MNAKKLLVTSSIAELLCLVLVYGPARPLVATVSGQNVGGIGHALLGALVVTAQMISWTLLPVLMLASLFVCMLHAYAARFAEKTGKGSLVDR